MSKLKIQKVILKAGRRWKAIPPEIFEDERLSLDARAVAGFICTRSDNFDLRASGLCTLLKLGKDKWRRIRNELMDAGYLLQEHVNGPNGQFNHDLFFNPYPTSESKPKRRSTPNKAGHPTAAKPPSDKRAQAESTATKEPTYQLNPPPPPQELQPDGDPPSDVANWQEIASFEIEKLQLREVVENIDGLRFRILQRYLREGGPTANVLKQFQAHQARLALKALPRTPTQEHEASTSNAAAQHAPKRNAAEQIAQSLSQQQRQTIIEHAEAAHQSFQMRPNARRAFLANGAIQPGPFAAILTELVTALKGSS